RAVRVGAGHRHRHVGRGAAAAPDTTKGRAGGMSATATETRQSRSAQTPPGRRGIGARWAAMGRARQVAWAGVALGVIAAYITVPPITIRTPVVSALLALAALLCGAWAVRAGEKRHGWGAIVVAIAGVALAVIFTQSGVGNLEQVFVWSA